MTKDERNPKPGYRRALGCAIAGLVIRISVFLRISSFVIRHSDLGIAVHGEPPSAFCACIGTMNRDRLVAQAFQPAGSRDIPVPCFCFWRLESRPNRQTGMSA